MFDELFQLNEVKNKKIQAQLDDNMQGTVKVAKKQAIDIINDYYKNYVFEIDLQTDLFSGIQFPSLPRNYRFLISPFDWPKKAEENPNGSLFSDPNKIDRNQADDIAMQCFGGDFDSSKMKMAGTAQPYAKEFESLNSVLDAFAVNEAINAWADKNAARSVFDKELLVRSIEDHNSNMQTMSTNVINAIRNYVSRSIDAISPLVQMTAGNIKDVKKKISTANSASQDNIKEWIKAQSEVEKQNRDALKDLEMSTFKKSLNTIQKANLFLERVSISNIPSDKRAAFIAAVVKDVNDVRTTSDLDELVQKFSAHYKKWKDFEYFCSQHKEEGITLNLNAINESIMSNPAYHYKYLKKLNEDEFRTREDIAYEDPKPDEISFDKIYQELYHYLSQAMSESIGERENWRCFKTIRDEMKVLKDRADEEIKKKIELVCKTGDLKSLIKWPFKAEGLLSMWTRYSSELQMRINNRVDQLMGSNGGVETGSATLVENFLTTTYPAIIAAMLTYKCVFQKLALKYKENEGMPKYTLDDFNNIIRDGGKSFLEKVTGPLIMWYDEG